MFGLDREVREIASRTVKETVKAVMPALIAMELKKLEESGSINAKIALAKLLANANTTYDTLIKEYHDHMNPKPKPRTFRNLWGLLSEDH